MEKPIPVVEHENNKYIVHLYSDAIELQTVPTKKNPDILVTAGLMGDDVVVMRVFYPDSKFNKDNVIENARKLSAKDPNDCPICVLIRERIRVLRAKSPDAYKKIVQGGVKEFDQYTDKIKDRYYKREREKLEPFFVLKSLGVLRPRRLLRGE